MTSGKPFIIDRFLARGSHGQTYVVLAVDPEQTTYCYDYILEDRRIVLPTGDPDPIVFEIAETGEVIFRIDPRSSELY